MTTFHSKDEGFLRILKKFKKHSFHLTIIQSEDNLWQVNVRKKDNGGCVHDFGIGENLLEAMQEAITRSFQNLELKGVGRLIENSKYVSKREYWLRNRRQRLKIRNRLPPELLTNDKPKKKRRKRLSDTLF